MQVFHLTSRELYTIIVVDRGEHMSNTEIQYIGVIAAEVNSIEQREIMKGIIHEAQALGKRTIVFSNLYNPYETDESLVLENQIYELMYSPMLSGLVLIAESFTNPALQQKVRDMLAKRQDIPVVIIGIFIPSLAFPNVRFINASDSEDILEITNHLIAKATPSSSAGFAATPRTRAPASRNVPADIRQ